MHSTSLLRLTVVRSENILLGKYTWEAMVVNGQDECKWSQIVQKQIMRLCVNTRESKGIQY